MNPNDIDDRRAGARNKQLRDYICARLEVAIKRKVARDETPPQHVRSTKKKSHSHSGVRKRLKAAALVKCKQYEHEKILSQLDAFRAGKTSLSELSNRVRKQPLAIHPAAVPDGLRVQLRALPQEIFDLIEDFVFEPEAPRGSPIDSYKGRNEYRRHLNLLHVSRATRASSAPAFYNSRIFHVIGYYNTITCLKTIPNEHINWIRKVVCTTWPGEGQGSVLGHSSASCALDSCWRCRRSQAVIMTNALSLYLGTNHLGQNIVQHQFRNRADCEALCKGSLAIAPLYKDSHNASPLRNSSSMVAEQHPSRQHLDPTGGPGRMEYEDTRAANDVRRCKGDHDAPPPEFFTPADGTGRHAFGDDEDEEEEAGNEDEGNEGDDEDEAETRMDTKTRMKARSN